MVMKISPHTRVIALIMVSVILFNFCAMGQGRRREPKEPILSGMMSIVPGCGQFYNEEYDKGIIFLSGTLVLSASELLLITFLPAASPWSLIAFLGIYLVLAIWTGIDAFICSHLYNRKHGFYAYEK